MSKESEMETPSRAQSKLVLNATRARQGRPGWDVLVVLLASTLLAVVALLVAWSLKFQDMQATRRDDRPAADLAQSMDQPPQPAP